MIGVFVTIYHVRRPRPRSLVVHKTGAVWKLECDRLSATASSTVGGLGRSCGGDNQALQPLHGGSGREPVRCSRKDLKGLERLEVQARLGVSEGWGRARWYQELLEKVAFREMRLPGFLLLRCYQLHQLTSSCFFSDSPFLMRFILHLANL
jgi:hypothetical protein